MNAAVEEWMKFKHVQVDRAAKEVRIIDGEPEWENTRNFDCKTMKITTAMKDETTCIGLLAADVNGEIIRAWSIAGDVFCDPVAIEIEVVRLAFICAQQHE